MTVKITILVAYFLMVLAVGLTCNGYGLKVQTGLDGSSRIPTLS